MTTNLTRYDTDVAEWMAHGFRCMVRKSIAWCGYVAVPAGHPWHGLGDEALRHVEVHGGVTFAEAGVDVPGMWWVGFDMGHALSPRQKADAVYETQRLAERAACAAAGEPANYHMVEVYTDDPTADVPRGPQDHVETVVSLDADDVDAAIGRAEEAGLWHRDSVVTGAELAGRCFDAWAGEMRVTRLRAKARARAGVAL